MAVSRRKRRVFIAPLKNKDNCAQVVGHLCITTGEIAGRDVPSFLLFMGGDDEGEFMGGGSGYGGRSSPARVARGTSALRYIS
jgi:hypothetical protein